MRLVVTTAKGAVRVPFYCLHCNAERLATILATGYGRGRLGVARVDALEAVRDTASDALAFVRCPSCGERDESSVRSLVGSIQLKGALLGLSIPCLTLAAMMMKGHRLSALTIVILAAVGLSLGLFYFFDRRRLWTKAAATISFEESSLGSNETDG